MSGWGLFQIVVILVLSLGIVYLAERTFNHGLRVIFHEFLLEIRRFVRREPSLEALNMLFGVLFFVGLILLVSAIAVSSLFSRAMPGNHSVYFPGDMLIFAGLFCMMFVFLLSIAFCVVMKRTKK